MLPTVVRSIGLHARHVATLMVKYTIVFLQSEKVDSQFLVEKKFW